MFAKAKSSLISRSRRVSGGSSRAPASHGSWLKIRLTKALPAPPRARWRRTGGQCQARNILARSRLSSAIRRLVGELFQGVDLVLTPTVAALPWAAEKPYPDRIDGKPASPRDHAIFTGWVNIAGVPALNIPIGSSRSGLPIGAHLVAAFGADDQLLAFAREISRRYSSPAVSQLEATL